MLDRLELGVTWRDLSGRDLGDVYVLGLLGHGRKS
jgi:hypothetical protein